jgi:hypothetical protein
MIKGFVKPQPQEPVENSRLQPGRGVMAGLVTGIILLVIPRGSPWAQLTFAAPVIMGRTVPPSAGMPLAMVWVAHLLVSLLYGLAVSWAVARLRQPRAVFVGGLCGITLYLINLAIVSTAFPDWRGAELSVVFTHVVFGFMTAAVYRGLLRRETA